MVVAEALGRQLNQPGEAPQLVAELLASQPPMLLVLDNFEQVVRYAADTVGLWRRTAPEVRILVTSRIALGLKEETPYRLRPLPPPSLDDSTSDFFETVSRNEAVRLFADCAARKKDNGFELDDSNAWDVAWICRALDGQPLPIVLVAGQLKYCTLGELVAEMQRYGLSLEDKELTQIFEWTYGLLQPPEQQVFQQSCTFHDGFSRDAARAVIQLDQDRRSRRILQIVQSLCDHSLLNPSETRSQTRFGMFRTIQEFGQALWGTSDDQGSPIPPRELGRRWINYFIEYSEHWTAMISTGRSREALDNLVRERENVMAAHEWALEAGEARLAARLFLAYGNTLAIRGPWQLRIPRLEATLERVAETEAELRARLLLALVEAHWAVGQWAEADACADQAVELGATLESRSVYAWALFHKARRARGLGSADDALGIFEEALAIFQELEEQEGEARTLAELSGIHDSEGRYEEAMRWVAVAETSFRRQENLIHLATTLNRKGLILWHWGRPAEAVDCFDEAEKLSRGLENWRWVGGHITNRGLALTDLERLDEAIADFDAAEKVHARQGNKAWGAVNLGGRGRALLLRGKLDAAVLCLKEARELADEVGYRDDVAVDSSHLGRAYLQLGRNEEALVETRRAVAVMRELYPFGNRRLCRSLTLLAMAEERLGSTEVARERVEEAARLAETLGLSAEGESRFVRDDLESLSELKARLG